VAAIVSVLDRNLSMPGLYLEASQGLGHVLGSQVACKNVVD